MTTVSTRTATPDERTKLRRLGDDIALVTLKYQGGATLDVAAGPAARSALLGPFASETTPPRSQP